MPTPTDEAFEKARWKEQSPTKWQEYVTWLAAGSPEDAVIKPMPGGELIALTKEVYDASRGFTPTDEQLHYIRTGLKTPRQELLPGESPMHAMFRDALRRADEPAGSWEARYKELVDEWTEFKAGEMQLEYPTLGQQMESWRRAGEPGKYVQKIFRDELGKLIGVSTFTPDEIEELGTFKPSEAQIKWAFRKTRKTQPKEQLKMWAEESRRELAMELELKEERRQELASLRTIKIEKGREIPEVLKIGGGGTLRARRRELETMLGTGVDR